jgi:hypothetical protein
VIATLSACLVEHFTLGFTDATGAVADDREMLPHEVWHLLPPAAVFVPDLLAAHELNSVVQST